MGSEMCIRDRIRVGYGDKRRAQDARKTLEFMYNMPLSESVAARVVVSQIISPGIYTNIQTGNTVGEEDDSQAMITFAFDDGGPLTGSLRFFRTDYKSFGIVEPGQSKPGSADVYVKDCPQANSWFYGESCQRLGAISNFTDSQGIDGLSVLSVYNPRYAHASVGDETSDDEMQMYNLSLIHI